MSDEPLSAGAEIDRLMGTPDVDKLVRSALDALTGVVFEDDRQVAHLVATSRWPAAGEGPGVTVTVTRLEETR